MTNPTAYQATAILELQRDRATVPLPGGVTDVCVIGGGIAGCSAALHLAERGLRVVLLETAQIGIEASGRSGGQVIPGYAAEQSRLQQLCGSAAADRLWDFSVEAVALVKALIERHTIPCDWRAGHLQAAIKGRHERALLAWQDQLQRRHGYSHTQYLNRSTVRQALSTFRYVGGLLDSFGGHLHPLNYTLGLARAAERAGATLIERSRAVSIEPGDVALIRTTTGAIRAKHVLVATNVQNGALLPQVSGRIMPVRTYLIATEALGEARAHELIREDWAVADSNFVLDYFRRSADHRLLFGGRVSYSGREVRVAEATRRRMLTVFPQLRDVRVEFSWSGLIDITMNRAPDFGRTDNVYYLQGFSGHGIALATLAGKIVAEVIAGDAGRFDVFARIPHRDFPGGRWLRTPSLVLAMLWYRLRDLL